MSNWSDWLDWGGRPAPVQSLNNLAGPTNPNVPYQWLRPPGAAFPTPQGTPVPMFGPTGGQMYPMFGGGSMPTQPLPAAATPVQQAPWAQRAAAAGYPTAPSGARMSFDLPVRAPGSAVVPYTGGTVPVQNPYGGSLAEFRSAQQARVMPQPGAGGQPALGWDPHAEQRAANEASWKNVSDSARRAKESADRTTAYAKTMGFDPDAPRTKPTVGRTAPTAAPGEPLPTRTPGTAGPTYGNVKMGGGAAGGGAGAGASGGNAYGPYGPPNPGTPGGTPPPAGSSTPGDPLGAYRNAGWNVNGAPPAGAPGSPGASYANAWRNVGQPTPNPYSAFWGRNPLNVRGALSATGSVGSKLPGVLTAPRNFGPSPTGAIGSRLPGFLTNEMSAGKSFGAGIGTALALHALPGFTAQIAPGITGRPLTEQGMETARSSAGAAGAGLMFGAPVAAAAGVGTFLGDAVGSSGGLGVANWLRGVMPEWMPGDNAPTDDTIGDILGRTPIGGWFGAGGEQQAQDPVAGLPPTLESIATVGQMAGLDPSSVGFLQQQFDGSMALARATYAADPEGSKKQFEALYGRPMESEDDLAQVLFSKIVQESLPAALENQSAQAAALQNAAMYQDFIGKYMQPIRDQYTDLASRAQAAGYGDLALQFQGQGASQESAMRAIPNLEALKAQQAQVNQLAQQQWQASMSGTGGATDPLGDASTLAALGVPTG